jgi:predicted DNA-binding transcriptional regulator
MFDDLIPTIIQILIEEKKEMVVSEIAEESSFGEVEIQRGLNLLYDLGIVNRAELSKNNFKYFLVKELKGIHLAKAAQLGIDLNAFDKHFKIDKKEKFSVSAILK